MPTKQERKMRWIKIHFQEKARIYRSKDDPKSIQKSFFFLEKDRNEFHNELEKMNINRNKFVLFPYAILYMKTCAHLFCHLQTQIIIIKLYCVIKIIFITSWRKTRTLIINIWLQHRSGMLWTYWVVIYFDDYRNRTIFFSS